MLSSPEGVKAVPAAGPELALRASVVWPAAWARAADFVKRWHRALAAATALTMLGFAVMMLFPAQLIRFFVPRDEGLVAVGGDDHLLGHTRFSARGRAPGRTT